MLFREVNEQRFDRAAEDAFEEAFAFGMDAIFLREERRVEVEIFVFLDGERLFFLEPAEEGFDGVGVPLLVFECLDDVVGWLGGFGPEDFHHFPFGFGNGGDVRHWN